MTNYHMKVLLENATSNKNPSKTKMTSIASHAPTVAPAASERPHQQPAPLANKAKIDHEPQFPSKTHPELPNFSTKKLHFLPQLQPQSSSAASRRHGSALTTTPTPPISRARLDTIIPSFQKRPDADKFVDFDKIVQLLTGKHTSKLYDRHAAVLDKLSVVYRAGPILADLGVLAEVLIIAGDKIDEGGTQLIQPVMKILQTLPHLDLSDAELRDPDMVITKIESIQRALARLVKLSDTNIVILAANAAFVLAGGRTIDPAATSTRRIVFSLGAGGVMTSTAEFLPTEEYSETDHLLLSATEGSSLVSSITKSLENKHTDICRISLLKCLRRLSTSDDCVFQMVISGTIGVLCQLIQSGSNSIVFHVVEVLWNTLESPHAKNVAKELNLKERLSALKSALDNLSLASRRQSNKQLRNELVVVLTRIADHEETSPALFLETGLMGSVGLYLMHPELDHNQSVAESVVLTSAPEDYEYKRLIVDLACKLASNQNALSALLRDGVLEFMMLYLDPNSTNVGVTHWTGSQRRCLQIQILGMLTGLIPHITHEFGAVDGYARLMNFLNHIIEQGHKPEMTRIDVAREHQSSLQATLAVVLSLTEVGPTSKKTLASFGIFTHLLSLLSETTQPTMTWCMALLICSSLCQGYKANRQVFGESNGVETLIPILRYTSAEPKERESVILAVIECIWGAVCGNLVNEKTFFEKEGIYLLLDLLENSTPKMKRHILGCLLDLLENPKSIYHLLAWRMRRDVKKGVEHLLIEMWCSEETELGVTNGPNGVLTPINNRPLLGSNQPKIDLAKNGIEPDGGRAIHELQENLRAKVYAMFCKLGFDRFNDTLSVTERIQLALISKYLDFKIGEVWLEIADELEFQGIRPVSPDLDCIHTVREVIVKKAEGVRQRQIELQRKSDETKREQEMEFYDQFISVNM